MYMVSICHSKTRGLPNLNGFTFMSDHDPNGGSRVISMILKLKRNHHGHTRVLLMMMHYVTLWEMIQVEVATKDKGNVGLDEASSLIAKQKS